MRHYLRTNEGRLGVIAAGVMVMVGVTGMGVASGQTPAPPVINACVSKGLLGLAAGSIRIVADVSACRANEDPLTWNQQGIQGPQGIQGSQGIQGPQGEPGPAGLSPVSGAFRVLNVEQALPGDTEQPLVVGRLSSSDGSGALRVPFPAQILVNGSAAVLHFSSSENGGTRCHLELASAGTDVGTLIGVPSQFTFSKTFQLVTLPLTGFANVEPGLYDVRLACTATSGFMEDIAVTVTAVPR